MNVCSGINILVNGGNPFSSARIGEIVAFVCLADNIS